MGRETNCSVTKQLGCLQVGARACDPVDVSYITSGSCKKPITFASYERQIIVDRCGKKVKFIVTSASNARSQMKIELQQTQPCAQERGDSDIRDFIAPTRRQKRGLFYKYTVGSSVYAVVSLQMFSSFVYAVASLRKL
jgi:hypothetical protein